MDDILHVANAEGIYDLSLGLLEKEKRLSIAGKSHNASAISFGEATEGAVEAHKFSVLASVTTTHSCNKKKRDAELVVTKQTLAKSIMSIRTTKVTNESKGKNKDESNDKKVESMNKGRKVTIEGMGKVLKEMNKQMDSGNNEDDYEEDEEQTENEEEDSKVEETDGKNEFEWEGSNKETIANDEEADNEVERLHKRMNDATALLQLQSDNKEGSKNSNFTDNNMSIHSGDLDNNQTNYKSAYKVLSGVFDAEYNKKYTDPMNFLQLIWNTAGPLVGAMIIQLELIKEELKADILGIPAEFKKIPAQLIDFMIKEAGKNTKEAIRFVEGHILHLNKIDNNNSKEECFQTIYPGETKEGINIPPKKAINA